MKKLLSILGTITIAGSGTAGIIGNAPTLAKSEINYLQRNNLENLSKLKRVKRDNHNRNAIDMQYQRTHYDFLLHISRENWEKTKLYFKISNNEYERFKWEFYNKINNFWKDSRMWDSGIWTITKTTFDNFEYINQVYNSLKNGHGLRIKIVQDGRLWNVSSQCVECSADSYEKYKNFNYYNEKIKLLGIGDGYRGEIGLDTLNDKIWFLGNNEQFHSSLQERDPKRNYNKIVVKNKNFALIKEIIINVGDSMRSIINKYNLENGIYYQNGYIIEISSHEPWRTKYYENNNWKYITKDGSLDRTINNLQQAFKIKNNKLSEYKYQLNDIITITNLKSIDKNTDKTILNELNYLNHDLDISQIEVINKTNISATVKAKNNSNIYIGSVNIHYAIDNNQQNKIINLNELIKKGIFLSFRDKNQGITIKEIKNINTNNLIYSNVTATKNIEPIYTKNSKSICFGTTTLFNNLPEKQNMKTPSCKYTKETALNSQITIGLSKTNSEEKRTEQTSTSSMEHNWNIELSTTGGIWPFAKASANAGVGGNYGSSNTNMSSETKTLSNTFDFSNSKTNEYKEISEVELPSQEIEVNPNQKIKITASLDEFLAQVTLKLTQNIYGEIISQITNISNEEKSFKISIKEIMQKLKEYNLLPQEITINNDDSISFNGNANRSLKQGFDGNIEFHEVK